MAWLLLALLILLLFMILTWRTTAEGFDQTIYISIGAYRDVECLRTVKDAFAKADVPGRVFVGVCQQNKESGEDCTFASNNVRVISLDYKEAKGPTYARYLCSTMYKGEDYFLQIDSHTRFMPGWDTRLLNMISQCPSPNPVITHYPHSYDPAKEGLPEELKTHVPVMCKSKWNGDGLPTFEAVMKPIEEAGLRRVPFMAGGMVFGPGRMFTEVQLDPGLDFLFQAEEFLLSARLYTHGWDLFTPSENVVLHYYERKDGPRFWQDLDGYRGKQAETVKRVRQLLGIDKPDISMSDPYGMGNARSLEEYWTFARLDPVARTSASEGHYCR